MYTIYDPTRAGSYIELIKWISAKKACVNIHNLDNKCVESCAQCHTHEIYDKRNGYNVYHYKKTSEMRT